MKVKNKVARALTAARKEKSTVLCSIRLKKNGQFSSVEGTVSDIKVSKDGNPYVVIQPRQKNRHVQSVSLDNILTVRVGEEVVKR
jgi:hypothetical protein